MDYLKCNSCGYYNEVKTEYQVLCSACGKRLENSFVDWAKSNHDKSFEDYKLAVCTKEVVEAPKGKTKSGVSQFKGKSVKFWVGFAVVFAVAYVMGYFAVEGIVGAIRNPSISKELVAMSNELNKNCPFMVDNLTRLDNAVILPNNVIQYNYTIVTVKDSLDVASMKQQMEPNIVNTVRTHPEMQRLRELETTMNYYYKDINGVFLFSISVTPENYKE